MSRDEANVKRTMTAMDQAEERAAAKLGKVVERATEVANGYRIIRFRGRAMVQVYDPFPHFVPLRKERFDELAYPILGGMTRAQMNDIFAYICNTAEDLTEHQSLILFGVDLKDIRVEATTDIQYIATNRPQVWDMEDCAWGLSLDADRCVWRSPYARPAKYDPKKPERLDFIMQLAGGSTELYDDIMQSIAPLVMARKPDGVIWWVGDGANGKSTLMDAIYRIFPGQLSSITVKRLTDGRDTPSLNGTLGNVVKESSEGRVDDTEIYKAIGTHEKFRVHKFHSQDDIEIQGNLHHIFSANVIPTFNDKGWAARRRTFIIPFRQRFQSDPMFEERTFTPEFFGQLIVEMCRYAAKIKKQGYRYKFSAITLAAKEEYDTEANNAEEFARDLIQQGVVAFDSFGPLTMEYENWCMDNGYVKLGAGNLRRAMKALGFERRTVREGAGSRNRYMLPTAENKDLRSLNLGRPGIYTMDGMEPEAEPDPEPVETEPVQEDLLGGEW